MTGFHREERDVIFQDRTLVAAVCIWLCHMTNDLLRDVGLTNLNIRIEIGIRS